MTLIESFMLGCIIGFCFTMHKKIDDLFHALNEMAETEKMILDCMKMMKQEIRKIEQAVFISEDLDK